MKEKIKLYVATPVHSDVSIHYMQSIIRLQAECYKRNVEFTLDMMKSSLVTQGRNTCVAHFLNTDYTHLLFVDSDILFYPQSIFKMLDKNVEMCSIPYPMKLINWDKVFDKTGVITSMNQLQRNTSGNKFPVKIKDEEHDVTMTDEMIELNYAPTGCMLLQRQVFDKMLQEPLYKKLLLTAKLQLHHICIIFLILFMMKKIKGIMERILLFLNYGVKQEASVMR